MKIYTKTGDDGSTGLFGGNRTRKDDARIECVGDLDELNAALGWAAVAAEPGTGNALKAVQEELFVIGSRLAVPVETRSTASLPVLDEQAIERLEHEIDAAEARLPPLRNFILPGGSEAASRLHLARAVCRRTERALVALNAAQPIEPITLIYLNRLSDWLFVQARLANLTAGVADVPWRAR